MCLHRAVLYITELLFEVALNGAVISVHFALFPHHGHVSLLPFTALAKSGVPASSMLTYWQIYKLWNSTIAKAVSVSFSSTCFGTIVLLICHAQRGLAAAQL